MANIPPDDIKKIADDYFNHEKKIICQKIIIVTSMPDRGLKWLEDKTGISERQLNRIRSQSANISLYTWCLIKASMSEFGPTVNIDFDKNKS